MARIPGPSRRLSVLSVAEQAELMGRGQRGKGIGKNVLQRSGLLREIVHVFDKDTMERSRVEYIKKLFLVSHVEVLV